MQDLLSLIRFFKETRQLTEKICQPLQIEDYLSQPIEIVSPPKWHLGHTTWFFEAVILKEFSDKYKVFNKEFFFLFNSYYNTLGERTLRNERGNQTRPTVKEVYEYRTYVDYELIKFIESSPDNIQEIAKILELGINHEKQHQELLITDIKYILYQNPSFPPYLENEINIDLKNSNKEEFFSLKEGIYNIGHNGEGFHFDNETGKHKVYLNNTRLSKNTVTNKTYLEFIQSGAYQDFRLWLSDGWNWLNKNNINGPLYWKKIENEWYYFTLYGLRKIDLELPVTHINYYEADAFASWSNKRLPTEFEWEVIARQNVSEKEKCNYLEKEIFTPNITKDNNLLGNVWEWTNSAYLAYPFFKKMDGAIAEYNGKFMANQMVLRGGSCATPFSQLRITYRNFFNLHERWQFTGIRLAEKTVNN